ncbi:MAG: DMT family transporter [Egibacteraceae bacterium]
METSTRARRLGGRSGERAVGVGLIVVSAAAFGTLPVFAKVAYAAGAEPGAVLLGRFAIGGVAMLAIMRLGGHRFPRGRLLGGLALMGAIGYVAQSVTYFSAASLISAGLTSLLFYVYPALVVVLAAAFLHQRLTPVKIAALGVALLGTALTIGATGGGQPLGVALGLASGLSYATYIVIGSRITPHVGAIPASTVIVLSACAVYAAAALALRPAFPQATSGWVALVGVALVGTVVSVVTFFAGLQRVGPSDASTLSTLEPVVTVVLAAAVLGERIAGAQLVGGGLILAAVVVLARAGPERFVPQEGPPA